MSWIIDLLKWLTCWLPHPVMIRPDQKGLRITGPRVKVLNAGIYWYVPLFQALPVTTVTPQPIDLRGQSVHTKCGVDMIMSACILYRIADVRKAVLEVLDYDTALPAIALGVVTRFVSRKQKEELHDIDALSKEVLQGTREEAAGWGLKIMKVMITDIGTSRNLRVIGDTNTVVGEISNGGTTNSSND